jgi:hypothetical protein
MIIVLFLDHVRVTLTLCLEVRYSSVSVCCVLSPEHRTKQQHNYNKLICKEYCKIEALGKNNNKSKLLEEEIAKYYTEGHNLI